MEAVARQSEESLGLYRYRGIVAIKGVCFESASIGVHPRLKGFSVYTLYLYTVIVV